MCKRIGIVAMMLALLAVPAQARPHCGTVKSGSAAIQQNGTTTTVTQWSEQAIVNWQKFGLSANELIKFIQPNSLATLLNRVTGVDPSVILGSIQANGRIFIVNPNGIVFGNGSRVDVGSLMATTLQISDQDFIHGNYTFRQCGCKPLSFIVNKGQIQAADGGWVVLVAPLIDNEGVIIANLGHVTLDATSQTVVSFDGNGMIGYAVPSSTNTHGDVMISNEALTCAVKHVVNQAGVLQAGAVVPTSGGVKLVGAQGTLVNNGTVRASGGTVSLNGDQANVSVGNSLVQAPGGTANLTGQNVILQDNSTVDVSAPNGGGNANIGGSMHGAGPLPNATNTFVGGNASIHADATCNGNGGTVVVWGSKSNQVYGQVTARGGASGGNGGFIETSSHGKLVVDTTPDTTAPKGKGGTWLLDPEDITITNTCANISKCVSGCTATYKPTSANTCTNLCVSRVNCSLNNGQSVVVCTKSGGSTTTGNINVCAPISWISATSPSLTLKACNSININSGITGINHNTGGTLSLCAPHGAVKVCQPISLCKVALASNSQTFNSECATIKTNGQKVCITTTGTAKTGTLQCVGSTTINNGGQLVICGPVTVKNGCFKQTGAGCVRLGNAITASSPGSCGISFKSPVTLTGCVTLTAFNAPITFGSTLSSAKCGLTCRGYSLTTITGTASTVFNGVVGCGAVTGATLRCLIVGQKCCANGLVAGKACISNNITTSCQQTYNGAVTLKGDATLQAIGGPAPSCPIITFNGTVNGAHNLATSTTPGGATIFNGVVGGTSPLSSLTVSGNACIGANISTTGQQMYGSVNLLGDVTLSTACSPITFNGALNGTHNLTLTTGNGLSTLCKVGNLCPLASLTVEGPARLNGCVTTIGAQNYNSAVTLGNSIKVIDCGSGNITFGNTLDSAPGTNNSLCIVTSSGSTVFNGAVGSHVPPGCLTVGGTACIGADITTKGSQCYNGAVHLTNCATLRTTNCEPITFCASVNGAHSLVLDSGSATVTLNSVGCSKPLSSLCVIGPAILNGNVTTTGAQNYKNTVKLGNCVSLTTCNSNVKFCKTLDSVCGTSQSLTTCTGTGSTIFNGTVGGTTPLSSLSVGNACIGASITTSACQTYSGAVNLTNDATLTTQEGNITFSSTLNGAHNLILNAGCNVVLGTVGCKTPLTSLCVTGATTLNGNITTCGPQTYNSPVTLADACNATLTSVKCASTTTAPISFKAPLNNCAICCRGFPLTINAGNSTVTLCSVGQCNRLNKLTVTGPTVLNGNVTTCSNQTYNSAVTLGNNVKLTTCAQCPITFEKTLDSALGTSHSLTTVCGTTVFKGNVGGITPLFSVCVGGAACIGNSTTPISIVTSGSQTYNGAVNLLGDATLKTSCAPINFNCSVNGAHNFVLNAGTGGCASVKLSNVGCSTPLKSLCVTGPTTLNGCVTTRCFQTYNSPVTLCTAATLTTTNKPITFASTINGANCLTLNAGTAAVTLHCVGNSTPLSNLTVCAGTTTLNGCVKASGGQIYNSNVLLNACVNLKTCCNTITFNGKVDSALGTSHSLTTCTGSCPTVFKSCVGQTTALSSLSVGHACIGSSSAPITIKTCGTQTYSGPVNLLGDATLKTNNSCITFGCSLNGTHNLTLNAGTGSVCMHNVGGCTPLKSLCVTAKSTTLNGCVTTKCGQIYNSPVTLGSCINQLTSCNGPITFNSTLNGSRCLTINAGSGAVTLGKVGCSTPLTSLCVTGSTQLNGCVNTFGCQKYQSPVTLGTSLTLSSCLGGITFNSTVDGAHSLTTSPGLCPTRFNGAVGSHTPLASLIANGCTDIGANITTTGKQCYTGCVSLTGDATLKTSCAPITLCKPLNGGHNLTINAGAGTVTLNTVGNCTPLTSLSVSGPTTLNSCVTTGGAQTYNSPVTLGASILLCSCSSSITFNSTVDGAHALTVFSGCGAPTTFNGAVGSHVPLTSLTSKCATVIGANITTTGQQCYLDPVTLSGDATLKTTNSIITFDSTVNGAHNLTLNAGNGCVSLQAAGNVTPLASLTVTGFTTLNGNVTTTGAQTYNSPVLIACTSNATLKSTNSPITFNSVLNSFCGANLTINAGTGQVTLGTVGCFGTPGTLTVTGPTRLNGYVVTCGTQTYNSPVTLGRNVALAASCGNIVFNSTVDSAPGTAQRLLTCICCGSTIFKGAVGSTTPLAALLIASPACIGASITTTGLQIYLGPVNLTGDATLHSTQNGLIGFCSTIDGAHNLTINAGTGHVVLQAPVGGCVPLTSLAITGPTTLNGCVTTTGSQTYNSAVMLSNACCAINKLNLKTTNSNITFNSTVSLAPSVAIPLITCTGTGATVFKGAVGSPGAGIASLSSLTTGNADIGANITTCGSQSYNGAVKVTAPATLTTSNCGITFASTVDGPSSLTVSPATNVTFNGAVGGITPLSSLTVNVPATLNVNVTTSGAQAYNGAITVGGNDTLTTSNGKVTFASTVNGATNGGQALTVNAGTGAVCFIGAIGNVNQLNALSVTGNTTLHQACVTTPSTQTYNGALNLTQNETLIGSAVTVDANVNGAFSLTIPNGTATLGGTWGSTAPLTTLTVNGPTQLGANVTTSGKQTFDNNITLIGDSTLTGSSLCLAGSINGPHALTLNPGSAITLTPTNAIGAVTPLSSFTVNAPSVNIDTNVFTTGNQTYTPSINLTQNTVLSAPQGVASFGGTVNGADSLTIVGGASFGGTVGGVTPLNALSVSGATTLNGNVTTTGTQSFGSTTLNTDTTLQGSGITFTGTVDGSHALNVNTAGTISLDGAVGANTPLTLLTLTGGAINVGPVISTTGSQTFTAPTITTGNSALSSAVGNITVNGAVNGSGLLSLSTPSGNVALNGTVTGGSVTVVNANNVTVNNATVTSFNQNAGSGTTTFNGVVQTTGSDSVTTATIDFSRSTSALTSSNGNVTLTATSGNIDPPTGALVSGQVVSLNAAQNVGPLTLIGSNEVLVIANTGNITLGAITAGSGGIQLTAKNGVISGIGPGIVNLTSGGNVVITSRTAGTLGDPIDVDIVSSQLKLLATGSLNGVSAAFFGSIPGKNIILVEVPPGTVYLNGKLLLSLEFPLQNDLIGTLDQLALQGVSADNVWTVLYDDNGQGAIFSIFDNEPWFTETTVRTKLHRRPHKRSDLIESLL